LNLSLSNLDDNEGVGNIAQVDFLASTDGLAYEDTLLVSTDNPGDGSWLGSWDTTDYPAGDYYLGARVYDSMGNELSIALDASVMISKNAEAVIDSITVQSGYGEMSSPTDFWTVAAIDALTFTAFFSDDGSAVTESWDFDGDLAVDSNANSDTWDYSVAGDFTVSYTVTEDDACWAPSQSLTAHVIADEDPEISNLAVDNVDPVTFEVTDSTATVSFDVEDSWYWSTGTIEAVNTATAEIIFSDSFESAEVPSSFSAPVAGAESFSFDFSLAGLAGGSTILVTVEVLDENGNSNAFGSGVTGFTVADEMDPALDDWLYPVPGQIIDSSVETVITVEISTLDFHDGVSSVEFYWHDMGWPLPNDAPFAVDADGSDGWTAEQNLTGMGGLTRIGVIIEDTSGNRSDYTVMEFCIDNCDPYQD
ncbi:MAG: hypothetical protein QGG33_04135, partial [Candidatus Krumholzibacteria bacterium]|nr:hypothetical protein [Candidatus Krumholzibacteria bacterium]